MQRGLSMATNTDWSKFQRKELITLLRIKEDLGNHRSKKLEEAISDLKATMEKEDVERVYEEIGIK